MYIYALRCAIHNVLGCVFVIYNEMDVINDPLETALYTPLSWRADRLWLAVDQAIYGHDDWKIICKNPNQEPLGRAI